MSIFGWLGLDGTYSRKQNRQGMGVLAGGKTSTRPLGGSSGITSSPTLTVSSTTWTVGSFTAVLDLETDATMGVTPAVFDGNSTGSVTAASSSFDRYDLLYITYADATSTPPGVLYVAGSVATTLPATPANSMALAQITVPKSGTGSPTATLIAPRGYAAGGIAACSGPSVYPATPYIGQVIDDAALGLLRWNGTVWQQYVPAASRRQDGGSTTSVPSGSSPTGVAAFNIGTNFNVGDIAYGAGIFTVGTAGVYEWAASWFFSPAAADGAWRMVGYIRHNGSHDTAGQKGQWIDTATNNGTNTFDSASGKVLCSAGDTVQLFFEKSGAGATVAVTASSMSLTRVA